MNDQSTETDIHFAERKHPGAIVLPVTAKNLNNKDSISNLQYAALASWKDGDRVRKRLYRSGKKMSIVTFMSTVCNNKSRLWDRCLLTVQPGVGLVKVVDVLKSKFSIYPVNRHRVRR